MENLTINKEYTLSGFLVLTTFLDNGSYIKQFYSGYSYKEAKAKFLKYISELPNI